MPLEKLEFKKSKRVLRRRCSTLMSELNKVSQQLIEGAKSTTARNVAKQVDKMVTSSSVTAEIALGVIIEHPNQGLQMFRTQTYGCLITEWHSFLNRVFDELTEHCLVKGSSDLVTKDLDISLKGADFSTKVQLRDSIRAALFEKFCSMRYPYRLNLLRKALKINAAGHPMNDLTKIMKKHVTVRNCLEHADSEIRKRDVESAGYGEKIPMLNANGTIREYVVGDTISISDNDVQNLKDTMLECISFFEVEL